MKNPLPRTADAAEPSTELNHDGAGDAAQEPPTQTASRRRRWPLVAGATAVLLVGSGIVATAHAHKTVSMDVDGKTTEVSTFAGSVGGLLQDQGITLGAHDLVVPAADSPLTGDTDIVVRYGHQVTVQVDGEQSDVWLTHLDADEALAALASRGDSVRLVASRSADGGRPALPLRLDANEPVNLVVDGTSTTVDGSDGVATILADAKITVGELDRVSVHRDPGAEVAVSLVVQRVTVTDVPTDTPIPFATVQTTDPNRYTDQKPVVTQEGVNGVTTTVNRVTTVDGAVESSVQVSQTVTQAPVDHIVATGTKERPTVKAPTAPAPKAPKAPAAPAPAAPSPVGSDVWAALAKCESGGNPQAVSKNGLYHGLYQFSVGTWKSVGGTGLPSQASPEEQTQRAQILQARSGWGQWPACSKKLGLR